MLIMIPQNQIPIKKMTLNSKLYSFMPLFWAHVNNIQVPPPPPPMYRKYCIVHTKIDQKRVK